MARLNNDNDDKDDGYQEGTHLKCSLDLFRHRK